nr:LysR substrate-binding domain-containing protein [Streptomyces scabiei]
MANGRPEGRRRCSRPPPLAGSRRRPQARDYWGHIAGMKAEPASQQSLEHFYLTLRAARAGVGITIAPYAVARDDLGRRQLVAPFGFVPDGTSHYLLSRRSPEQDGRVRRLTAWLRV